MLRAIWFLIILGALAALSVWFADNPGRMTLVWQGYLIETSAAVLVVAVAVFAVAVALLYRFWIALRGVPAGFARNRRENRRRHGYQALTRGMVAVAAGDAVEAKSQAGRADGLLREPPLTMLLSAQAAQLDGDEDAAEKFFTEMLERSETEFLGLRGLLGQAVKREDGAAALKLVRRAYRLKPKSDWVVRTLFDLETRSGNWAEADTTLSAALANKLIAPAEAVGHKAVLALQQSLEAEHAGQTGNALKLAKLAHGEDPGLIPAAHQYARLLIDEGKQRKAAGVIETAWARQPHPDLAEAYWRARGGRQGGDEALERMRHAEKLAATNPKHDASRMLLAAVAIDAGLWGVAAEKLEGLPVTRDYCRLMAAMLEGDKDEAQAHEWLVRATGAEPDAAWVCSDCGNLADAWTALCGKCGAFDTFKWQRPPSIPGLAAPDDGNIPLLGTDTVIDDDGP